MTKLKSPTIRPTGDRILVQRTAPSEKTKGGILLPEAAKDKPKDGTVLAVGPGRTLDDGSLSKPTLKRGDRILFGAYAGTEIEHGGEKYLLMREEDVLGVMDCE